MAFKLTPKSSGFKLKPKAVVDDMPPMNMPIEEPVPTRELTQGQKLTNVLGNILSLGGQKVYSEAPTPQELEYEKQSPLLAGAEIIPQMATDVASFASAGVGTGLDYLGFGSDPNVKMGQFDIPFSQRFQESMLQYDPTTEKSKKYYEKFSENLAALPATYAYKDLSKVSKLQKQLPKTPDNLTQKLNKEIQLFVNKDYKYQLDEFTKNAKFNDVVKESADAGYKIIPSSVKNAPKLDRLKESSVGTAKIAEQARESNQQITNNLVRKYLGLDEKTPLDLELMEKIRRRHGKTYRKIDSLEAPKTDKVVYENVYDLNTGKLIQEPAKVGRNGKEVLDQLKQARYDLRETWTFFKMNGNPYIKKNAEALELKVKRLENELIDIAKYNKREDLIPELNKARTEIAKAHLVEKALNDVTGNVDAKVFSKLAYDKRLVDPNARKVARFYKGFSDLAKVPKSAEQTPFSVLDVGLAGYGFATGNVQLGLPAIAKLYSAKSLTKPNVQQRIVGSAITEPKPKGMMSLLRVPQDRSIPRPSEEAMYSVGLASLLDPLLNR